MAKKEMYILYAAISAIVILVLLPNSGLFSTVNINEIYPCPKESNVSKPCEGAYWVDTPKCYWNVSNCEGYCDTDDDCKINVDAPNDCSLFFQPHKVLQIGYCKNKFCQWLEVPEAGGTCNAFQLFLQTWKWAILAIVLIIIAFFVFEKDYGGKKRGLI